MALPMLHYGTTGLSSEDAFSAWRNLMAMMYKVDRAAYGDDLPSGNLSCCLVGDIMANRTSFSAQRVTRDKRLISRSPDHLVLQLWRTGGTRGEVAGRSSSYNPGQVALADRRLEVDSLITKSDTIGIVIPRSRLDGMKIEGLSRHLDPRRNRLAAARLKALWRRLPDLGSEDVPAVTNELLSFFRRLFDPSKADDVLEGPEFDCDVVDLAGLFIERNLGSTKLSPETIAAALGISRSSLYRVASPLGGITRHIGERRLLAARNALADPLEARSLTKLAEDLGFSSLSLFSRAFRARYGVAAREWRATSRHNWRAQRKISPDPIWNWFSELGS